MENSFVQSMTALAAFHMYLFDIAEGNVKTKPELRKTAIYFTLTLTGEMFEECSDFSGQDDKEIKALHDELWEAFAKVPKQYDTDTFHDTLNSRLDNAVEHAKEWVRECDEEITSAKIE